MPRKCEAYKKNYPMKIRGGTTGGGVGITGGITGGLTIGGTIGLGCGFIPPPPLPIATLVAMITPTLNRFAKCARA